VVSWPSTFKLVNIDKYHPKENPEEWAHLYRLGVKAAHGDSDVALAYVQLHLQLAAVL